MLVNKSCKATFKRCTKKPQKHLTKSNLHTISASSFYIALVIIFSFIPYTGYWRVTIVNFTTLPVLIAIANFHINKFGAISVASAIGVGSWLRALVFGDPTQLFIYPDVAVLPRVLVGIVIFLITTKILPKMPKFVFFLSALLSVFLNTTFVTAFIYLHHEIIPNAFINDKSLLVWIGIIWVNFVVELLVAFLLAFGTLKLAFHLRKKSYNLAKISWN